MVATGGSSNRVSISWDGRARLGAGFEGGIEDSFDGASLVASSETVAGDASVIE
jgi:hypothetical protein